ncbi:MAG TPA: 2-keto-4-pentenoate hydratase [Clostridiales bacterium]|jgi:2-keto-4-pentenoate hydratase|nr:2-keto-4-pentenoate hydratase [Clostridiales bacterium]
MKEFQIKEAADKLWEVLETKKPVAPLTELYKLEKLDDAYKIQLENIEKKKKMGKKVIGKKIGLTSKAMQKALGVNEPDYGFLMEDMIFDENTPIVASERLIQPKVEPELAFVLKEELKGPGITIVDVLRATKGIMISFEIIDSRIKDWKIKLPDTIADNASSGMFVLGSKMISLDQVDLKTIGLVFEKNGEIIDTATSAAVLGNPALAVAWLANKLSEYDISLKKGEIILSGAFVKAQEVKIGDVFTAEMTGLGTVKTKFI